MKKICPTCKNEVERIAACGAEQYFCNHCKKLISRKEIIEA